MPLALCSKESNNTSTPEVFDLKVSIALACPTPGPLSFECLMPNSLKALEILLSKTSHWQKTTLLAVASPPLMSCKVDTMIPSFVPYLST